MNSSLRLPALALTLVAGLCALPLVGGAAQAAPAPSPSSSASPASAPSSSLVTPVVDFVFLEGTQVRKALVRYRGATPGSYVQASNATSGWESDVYRVGANGVFVFTIVLEAGEANDVSILNYAAFDDSEQTIALRIDDTRAAPLPTAGPVATGTSVSPTAPGVDTRGYRVAA